MARNGDSLAYIMKSAALGTKSRNPNQNISDRDTVHSYKASINRFCSWAKENGLTKEQVLANPKEHLQAYTDHLIEKGLSKSTIHTYIAAPCKALHIPMQHISKPQRSIDDITRSRGGKNPQGQRESQKPQFERLVSLQGKGGKEQWQRILPRDTEMVQRTFSGIKKDDRVFTPGEMKNKIDLHQMRAMHAKECYDYYATRIKEDPAYREQLREELKQYYQEHHNPNGELDLKGYEDFCRDMAKNEGMYQMRGESRKLAEEHERPTDYDRVALMAVSTFHLAHWRLDVTITNYLA